ncbi:putative uncharacterized protein DDB_G0271606 [Anopheles aquasalis]|uniref:putative uncharacterized protein DDB_G0271606 n=1 Tax=Anopheles aquasalis TaxID=42839 RepID=UPI00215ACEE3|nr:putative uncharacterized protein DDB_G0271606 [Anopheles aquasalis]
MSQQAANATNSTGGGGGGDTVSSSPLTVSSSMALLPVQPGSSTALGHKAAQQSSKSTPHHNKLALAQDCAHRIEAEQAGTVEEMLVQPPGGSHAVCTTGPQASLPATPGSSSKIGCSTSKCVSTVRPHNQQRGVRRSAAVNCNSQQQQPLPEAISEVGRHPIEDGGAVGGSVPTNGDNYNQNLPSPEQLTTLATTKQKPKQKHSKQLVAASVGDLAGAGHCSQLGATPAPVAAATNKLTSIMAQQSQYPQPAKSVSVVAKLDPTSSPITALSQGQSQVAVHHGQLQQPQQLAHHHHHHSLGPHTAIAPAAGYGLAPAQHQQLQRSAPHLPQQRHHPQQQQLSVPSSMAPVISSLNAHPLHIHQPQQQQQQSHPQQHLHQLNKQQPCQPLTPVAPPPSHHHHQQQQQQQQKQQQQHLRQLQQFHQLQQQQQQHHQHQHQHYHQHQHQHHHHHLLQHQQQQQPQPQPPSHHHLHQHHHQQPPPQAQQQYHQSGHVHGPQQPPTPHSSTTAASTATAAAAAHQQQQSINLNVNHHVISAPIVVDFSNMTVNCVQLQEASQHPNPIAAAAAAMAAGYGAAAAAAASVPSTIGRIAK